MLILEKLISGIPLRTLAYWHAEVTPTTAKLIKVAAFDHRRPVTPLML